MFAGDADPTVPAAPAVLAHELANLLDAAMRNLGLALDRLRDSPAQPAGDDAVRRLETVGAAMRQMTELLERWSDGRGQRPLDQQSGQSLKDVVDHAVRLLGPAADSVGTIIAVDLAEDTAKLSAGPLYPLIANALRNSIEAIKSGPRQGSIRIVARLSDGQVEFTILDDGPGLSPAVVDERGRFRVGHTTKPGGHGIGLMLSHDIATRLGGTLTLTNRLEGGAALTLRYPAAAVEAAQE